MDQLLDGGFHSADDARKMLLSERVALLRCRKIRVSSPPFDRLSALYRVSDHSPISPLRLDRVRYTLSGDDSYEFSVSFDCYPGSSVGTSPGFPSRFSTPLARRCTSTGPKGNT